jgi:ABC-2 type transport system ATP-binding protein
LLDEPTVGVDPQSRNHLLANIEALRELGKTILYTTHYMEEAQRICDRVAILDHGKLLAFDRTEALLARYAGEPRVSVEQPSLEQVFLELTGRSLRD